MDFKEDEPRQGNLSTDNDDVKNENEMYDKIEKIEHGKKTIDLLTSKTAGPSISSATLRLMQAEINDKNSEKYQRISWEILKKSIYRLINKVNRTNIHSTIIKLFKKNIIRGRGLLTQAIIQTQATSLIFTDVYAAVIYIINIEFPAIGELLLTRLVLQFKHGYKNDKAICISSAIFIAQLFNHEVVNEVLIVDIIELLIQEPTDNSIEVVITVLRECGIKLKQVYKNGTMTIFKLLKKLLYEGKLNRRVQYMIKGMLQFQKKKFNVEYTPDELDHMELKNLFKHQIELTQPLDSEEILNEFQFDYNYTANENKYKELSEGILKSIIHSENEENSDEEIEDSVVIIDNDNTETHLRTLREDIFSTIHSSEDFEKSVQKFIRMQLQKPGHEMNLCHEILDCCKETRIYQKNFGLLAEKLCANNTFYGKAFEFTFKNLYDKVHWLDINFLSNIAKFFAYLLMTDSISWAVLFNIKLNEEDTTSTSRVFIKILFQELSDQMGFLKLNMKLKSESLQESFATPFAINFFTTTGLGGLTEDLRKYLNNKETDDGDKKEDSATAGR